MYFFPFKKEILYFCGQVIYTLYKKMLKIKL